MKDTCVHTRHCCAKHGCKYGQPSCPVYLGVKEQEYDCEDCYSDYEEINYWLKDFEYFNKLLKKYGFKLEKLNNV